MLEALWSVEFVSNVNDFGAGVVVLETSRVLGGDSQYYYVGTFKLEGKTMHASIQVTHFAGPASSVFGPQRQFNLQLSGTPSREQFLLQGHMVENPQMKIGIRLTRRAELP